MTVPPIISGLGKATNFKFGRYMDPSEGPYEQKCRETSSTRGFITIHRRLSYTVFTLEHPRSERTSFRRTRFLLTVSLQTTGGPRDARYYTTVLLLVAIATKAL